MQAERKPAESADIPPPKELPAGRWLVEGRIPAPRNCGFEAVPEGAPGVICREGLAEYSEGMFTSIEVFDTVVAALSKAAGFDPDETLRAHAKDASGGTITNDFEGRGEAFRWTLLEFAKNAYDHVLQAGPGRDAAVYYGPVRAQDGRRGLFVASYDNGPGWDIAGLEARDTMTDEKEGRGVFWAFMRDLASRYDGITASLESGGRSVTYGRGGGAWGMASGPMNSAVVFILAGGENPRI